VCRYATQSVARLTDWRATLVSLHDPAGESVDETSGLRIVCLGLGKNAARLFLRWLEANPQDLIITSDVSYIESAFCHIPPSTLHVMQIHDSLRRYRAVPVRHAQWIDGVTCVGKHIEVPLRRSLQEVGFHGLLRAVHNGAEFPPEPHRIPHTGPLRLLFMGRVEPLKGVFDFVPLLQKLKQSGVPVTLNMVGGENQILRRQFKRKGLEEMVTWRGRVPHAQCYDIAAESDIFLMASRKEPFGMVTIESMSMGCVPIAYNVPSGSVEIIEHGQSGLLVPLGDIRAWAEQIRSLNCDRERLAALSAGAIQRARGVFNSEVMAKNLVAFLKDVMAHAKNHPAQRQQGLPAEEPEAKETAGYQRLPHGLREWIRNCVCASPKLSYWLLNR